MTLSDPCKIHENHPAGRCDEHTLDMLTDFPFWNTKSKRCVNTDNRPLFHSNTTSLGQGLEFFDCTVSKKGKKAKKGKQKVCVCVCVWGGVNNKNPRRSYKHIILICNPQGGGDSSVVRAPDSWLKGRGFESLLERRENFLLQGRLSVLILISVSVPPPCYRSST